MYTLKRKMIYFIGAALFAYAYYGLTALIFFVITDENLLIATVLNAILIILFVIIDKLEVYIYIKLKTQAEAKQLSLPKKIIMWCVRDNPSTKSVLYLFYIVILICTAIVTAEPDFPRLSNLTDYFQSVYYGLLILVAADKFTQQLFKDISSNKFTV